MAFTDKQTLDDLIIFGKRAGDSVYAIFNRTATAGGATILEQMFQFPLSEVDLINQRSAIIQYFIHANVSFPVTTGLFDLAENYLSVTDSRSQLTHDDQKLGRQLNRMISADTELTRITKGITALIEIMQQVDTFVRKIDSAGPYALDAKAIRPILEDEALALIRKEQAGQKISYDMLVVMDKVLRFQQRDTIRRLLHYLYQLDVYISVAKVATEKGFVMAQAMEPGKTELQLEGCYHPLVPNAVGNTITMSPQGNVIFLTGANMAGKSTFMKSVGIAVFLAHMGFPVPANSMTFPVMDGIFTTINLPDNLGMGYSHFYAEVLRVKKIAQDLHEGKKLFIIFDELFRGTNVKDAYDATVALLEGFARKQTSLFVVSTHIIEAGEELKSRAQSIQYQYLPTRLEGGKPVYAYKLVAGISSDRHGMVIIENEGILDILRSRNSKLTSHALHHG